MLQHRASSLLQHTKQVQKAAYRPLLMHCVAHALPAALLSQRQELKCGSNATAVTLLPAADDEGAASVAAMGAKSCRNRARRSHTAPHAMLEVPHSDQTTAGDASGIVSLQSISATTACASASGAAAAASASLMRAPSSRVMSDAGTVMLSIRFSASWRQRHAVRSARVC